MVSEQSLVDELVLPEQETNRADFALSGVKPAPNDWDY
jgi:hypothetical protein